MNSPFIQNFASLLKICKLSKFQINEGFAATVAPDPGGRLPGDTQKHRQTTLNLNQRIGFNLAECCPDLVPPDGDHLLQS
jgi:hypothetical protein